MMPLSMRAGPGIFYFCKLQTFSFFVPVPVFFTQDFGPVLMFFAQEGPRTSFGSVFGLARVQISHAPLLRSGFLLHHQKSVFKSSYGVCGMGPPQGSAFACAVTAISKKAKLA